MAAAGVEAEEHVQAAHAPVVETKAGADPALEAHALAVEIREVVELALAAHAPVEEIKEVAELRQVEEHARELHVQLEAVTKVVVAFPQLEVATKVVVA